MGDLVSGPAMVIWGIQLCQAVWYTTGQPPAIGELFRELVGTPAASTQTTPGISLATGQDLGSTFRLQLQPGRIDFFEHAAGGAAFAQLPVFSDFAMALQNFRGRLRRATVGDVGRVALIVTMAHPSVTGREALDLVLTKIGIDLPFRDVSDFIFQINRRRHFAWDDKLEMHRVLKWSADVFQVVQLNFVGAGAALRTQNVASFVVDVSNALVDGRSFNQAEQISMFEEVGDEVDRLCNANSLGSLA